MIDFHTHSSASDGNLSPAQVVAEALAAGLSGVGLMDHDTAGGLDEARTAASLRGLKFIPGVELTAYHNGREWHILAMLIDAPTGEVARRLAPFIERRRTRMAEMAARLRRDGYDITPDEVEAEARGGMVGRMHLARLLIAKGYASSNDEVYRKFIGNSAPYYAPKLAMSVAEAVALALELGGVPVVAHPGIPGDEDALPEFAKAGIAGIEAYTPKHSPGEERRYAEIGRSLGLVVTAGSDFHGREKHAPNRIGSRSSPDEVLDALLELKESRVLRGKGT